MFSKKDYLLIGLICLFFGFITTKQFYLQKQVVKVSQPESGNSIALEVAELIETNSKLRKDIDKLNSNLQKLADSASSSQKASEAVTENLNIYKIILGLTDVTGPGVEITFDDKTDSTQIIDLINAIKNIGAEAITINNKRLTGYNSIETGVFYPPTIVQVIGDADLLKESLIRPGGIIEQIGAGKVAKKDGLSLRSI